MPGNGGGGGALPDGNGGGCGAALVGNGGGGGASPGALGMGGAGGMDAEGCGLFGLAIAGLSGVEPALSRLDSGRGGPIVPKSMAASCFAPPPVRPSSSSSDSSSAEDSMADHSSSSCLARVVRGAALPVVAAFAMFSCVRRWKGFVDTAGSAGGVGTAGAEAVPLA
jgi:hypothetical protein